MNPLAIVMLLTLGMLCATPALAADRANPPADLSRLLGLALRDYQGQLPDMRKLEWLELQTAGSSHRRWNEATQRFFAACRQQPDACMPLLRDKLKSLDKAVRNTPSANATGSMASVVSAIADLCAGFPGPGRPFDVCGLSLRLYEAAMRWLGEGNELLFVDYLRGYDLQRAQYLDWLQSQGQMPDVSILHELPELPDWVRAIQWELLGHLSAARFAWMETYAIANQEPASSPLASLIPQALLHIARLSWRLGEHDLAREFERQHAQHFIISTCEELALAWRVDIARASAVGQWPTQSADKLAAVIQGGCGYTQAMVELGIDALLLGGGPTAPQRSEAASVMTQALGACASGNCARYRRPQLQALLSALKGDTSETAAWLKTRLKDLGQLGGLPESELRLNWALGADQLPFATVSQDALALLSATQTKVLIGSSTIQQVSFEDQRDLSRYDGLHRLVARASVQHGQTLALTRTETLRAQTLLRRLRLEQLKAQLVDTRDSTAKARYRADVAKVTAQTLMHKKFTGTAIGAWFDRIADDFAASAELQYVEALAAEKLKNSEDGNRSWLYRSLGPSAVGRLVQQGANLFAAESESLASDEVYLSWLQVPGGYVASVVQGIDGQLSNHWIPVSDIQQANLKLYRDLLGSGSASPIATVGLSLRDRPVWRNADGSYTVSAAAPAGSVRVQLFEEIARELYALLLNPLPLPWQQAKRLVISPDGALSQLPFETLWQGNGPLLAAVDVSYVQSMAVHAELKRRAAEPRPVGQSIRIFSLADPSYTAPTAENSAPPDWMSELGDWPSLPGTLQESNALLQLFNHKQNLQLLGPDAAQATLKALDKSGELAGFRVLHFATHGYVDDQRSALVLSMSNGTENAYLQDGKIAKLSLHSDLVLLSACDTGLGRNQSGEGVMGLPYAFMLAGNIDTVMSLWWVSDRGTATFIPAFMANVRIGMDLVAALNATKREFNAGKFGDAFRDPRIWAAFVLYGVPLKL